MIYGTVVYIITGNKYAFQMGVNVFLCFFFTLMKLFPKDRFILSRLSFRIESIALVQIFLSAFGGLYLNFYYTIDSFDMLLHFFVSIIAVYICYELTFAAMKDKTKMTPAFGALCGIGWVNSFAIFWEIFEFTYDQLTNSNTQHWDLKQAGPNGTEIFHFTNPMRYALFDTMSDLILGFAGALLGGIIVYVWLKKRAQKAAAAPQEKTAEMYVAARMGK